MFVSVLAIWKRPPIDEVDLDRLERERDARPRSAPARTSRRRARSSRAPPCRRAPLLRKTAIASTYASTASRTRPTRRSRTPRERSTSPCRRGGTLLLDGRVERGEGAIARGERALHVAQLAEQLADERLGLDLERGDLRRVRDLGGLLATTAARARGAPRRSRSARSAGAPRHTARGVASAAHEAPQGLEVLQALATPPEHAVGALERLVSVDAPRVVGPEQREGALVVADRERRLVAVARGVGGLEVEVDRPVVRSRRARGDARRWPPRGRARATSRRGARRARGASARARSARGPRRRRRA